ncbi:MAG: 4Fe-4S dicluster domain-containing protein [Gammaproteobacteria bacterium]|jgi:ferredoxin
MSKLLKMSKADMLKSIDKAVANYKVAALTKKNGQPKYDYVSNGREVMLNYVPTILSPKKFFFPQDEVFLEYTADGKVDPKISAEPLLLFGIRPCDLNAIKVLDEAFAESNGDPNYLAKREKSVIVGIDCKKICDENAFCYKVRANYAAGGCDVMLYEYGSDYLVESMTDKGEKFCKKYLAIAKTDGQDKTKYDEEKKQGFAGTETFENLDKLPEVFEKNKDHAVWEEEGKKCLSCGSCIMVCPTCYCFDVADELALSLKKGERIRRWDACMLSSFAVVAGGESFRPEAKQRLHHRLDRKFNFLMKKHNQSVCVGCGRCVRACLADISPKKIVEKIVGEGE